MPRKLLLAARLPPHVLLTQEDERIDSVALLSRNLGLRLVAEGVDAPDQVPMLQSMEIAAGQGPLFGEPMEPCEAERWLRGGGRPAA